MMVRVPIDPDQLRRHLADYAAVTRRRTDRFVCPITERECDESELQNGHIPNGAIHSASRKTVIQYKAVDNFYGGRVEPTLIDFINLPKKTDADLMEKAGALVVKFADGSEAPAFFAGPAAGKRFPLIDLRRDGKVVASVYVRTAKDDPRLAEGTAEVFWEVRFKHPLWTAAMVKASYLALFRLLGYNAVRTGAGEYIRQTLHGYFRDDASREDAAWYFYPFRNALKLALRPDGTPAPDTPDTLTSNTVMLHYTAADDPMFAASLLFRMNDVVATVTLPMTMDGGREADAMRVYNRLMEDETSVEQHVRWAALVDGAWHLHPAKRRITYKGSETDKGSPDSR